MHAQTASRIAPTVSKQGALRPQRPHTQQDSYIPWTISRFSCTADSLLLSVTVNDLLFVLCHCQTGATGHGQALAACAVLPEKKKLVRTPT